MAEMSEPWNPYADQPAPTPKSEVPVAVDQPSKFPTNKVVAASGTPLVLYQFFDVLRDVWQIHIVPSARELLATALGAGVAWFVREFKVRRGD